MTVTQHQRTVRKIITPEIFRLAREHNYSNKGTKEVTELLRLSIRASHTLPQQIASGLSADEILPEKGKKPKDYIVINGLIYGTRFYERSIPQKRLNKRILSLFSP